MVVRCQRKANKGSATVSVSPVCRSIGFLLGSREAWWVLEDLYTLDESYAVQHQVCRGEMRAYIFSSINPAPS